jgi:hypothetical protein
VQRGPASVLHRGSPEDSRGRDGQAARRMDSGQPRALDCPEGASPCGNRREPTRGPRCSIREHLGGGRVAQHVRRHVADPAALTVELRRASDRRSTETLAWSRHEQHVARGRPGSPNPKPAFQRCPELRLVAQRDDSLAGLALPHPHLEPIEIDVPGRGRTRTRRASDRGRLACERASHDAPACRRAVA